MNEQAHGNYVCDRAGCGSSFRLEGAGWSHFLSEGGRRKFFCSATCQNAVEALRARAAARCAAARDAELQAAGGECE